MKPANLHRPSPLPNTFSLRDFLRRQGSFVFSLCVFVLAGTFLAWEEHHLRYQHQTLQWPIVPGKIVRSELVDRGSYRRHDWSLSVAYTYDVAGRRYESHRATLWSREADDPSVRNFFIGLRAGSDVDVYYDPRHPESAVLIPGDDGPDRILFLCFRWLGICLLAVVALDLVERLLLALGLIKRRRLTAQIPQQPPKTKPKPRDDPVTKGKPFLTYEPANKCKLTCFPDKQCLLDFLGHIGKSMQDWTPEDRAIDSSGRVFRFVHNPKREWYNLEPTGETWDHEKILALVIADGRLSKCTPETLRQRVAAVPDAQKIRTILDSMDSIDSGSTRALVGLLVFLLLFGAGVFYLTLRIVNWLSK